ncbi:TolC family protein [Catenovulum sediminis]|uniref:TolC family protein n=1 Tax=Catenovulum sediminis TaxID=1740262 RepID=A0ABV1RCG3_9ALTE|nr:TolC family protein [Catenovulum sediminis]
MIKYLGFALFVLLYSYRAESCPEANTVTIVENSHLTELVKLILVNSYDVKKGLIDLQISEQNIQTKLSEFYPKVDVALSIDNIKKYGTLPGIDSVLLQGQDDIDSSTFTTSLSVNLYSGGYHWNNYKKSLLEKQLTESENQFARFTIAQKAIQLYHNLKVATLNYQKSQLKLRLEQNYLTVQTTSFRAGLINEAELHDQQKSVWDLEQEVAYFDYETKIYEAILLELLDEDVVKFNHQIAVYLKAEDYVKVFADLGVKLEKNIDVLKAESHYQQSKYDIELAKSRYRPKFDLSVNQIYFNLSKNGSFDAFDHMQQDRRQITLSMRWNLFEGFAADSKYKSAVYQSAKLKMELLDTQREIKNQNKEIHLKMSLINKEVNQLQRKQKMLEREFTLLEAENNQGLIEDLAVANQANKLKIIDIELLEKASQIALLKVDEFSLVVKQ